MSVQERSATDTAGALASHDAFPIVGAHQHFGDLEANAFQLLKDLDLVLDRARASGAATLITALVGQLYRLLVSRGHGEIDASGMYTLFRQRPCVARSIRRMRRVRPELPLTLALSPAGGEGLEATCSPLSEPLSEERAG